MKPQIIILFIIQGIISSLSAQNNIDQLLQEIEINNPILISLRKNADAEKMLNKTGIYLENPEFEFNYLSGNPSSIGNRTDIKITQTIDFPLAYTYKNQISEMRINQVEMQFEKQKKIFLLQARILCIEIIFKNAMDAEYAKRIANAQFLADAYKEKFSRGASSLPELNKVLIHLSNLKLDAEINHLEKNARLAEIVQLNGGKNISLKNTTYDGMAIINDFEIWFSTVEANNPTLNLLQEEIEIGKKQEKLNLFLGFPKIQGGYMSEKIPGEHFQGLTMGLSIPLLQNKNQLKYARLKTEAWENIESAERTHYYYRLQILFQKAKKMDELLNEYKIQLSTYNQTHLLKRSVELGEMSLIQYFQELSNYYESMDKLLRLEMERNLVIAELLESP